LSASSYRLDIEYDGSAFSGWAKQPGLRTVQGELEAPLATVLREPVELTVAGRTDAGVHAWGQVASFRHEGEAPTDLARRLNALGPVDVSVRSARRADGSFDARRDARSRTYCYRVLARPAPNPFERGRALWWPHRLDPDALHACAGAIVGEHDFTAFTPTQTDHVRFERLVEAASWSEEEELLSFWVTADAFMRNMVRVLVGTMLEVAGGRRELDSLRSLLRGGARGEAGETAPAHGLYLASVAYPGERPTRFRAER
jgi:tRNA pseudouridine38-40 synthase